MLIPRYVLCEPFELELSDLQSSFCVILGDTRFSSIGNCQMDLYDLCMLLISFSPVEIAEPTTDNSIV